MVTIDVEPRPADCRRSPCRSAPTPGGTSIAQPVELADRDGSFIPFAWTLAEREAADDPRPSVEERYVSGQNYVPDTKSCRQKYSAAVPLFGPLIPLIGRQNSAVRQRSGICVGHEWNQLLATLYFGLWRA